LVIDWDGASRCLWVLVSVRVVDGLKVEG